MKLKDNLKILRQQHGYTLEELARIFGNIPKCLFFEPLLRGK